MRSMTAVVRCSLAVTVAASNPSHRLAHVQYRARRTRGREWYRKQNCKKARPHGYRHDSRLAES
jgi:hypothetical protein